MESETQSNSNQSEATEAYNAYMKKLHDWNLHMKRHRWMQYNAAMMMHNLAFHVNVVGQTSNQATRPAPRQNANHQFSSIHRTFLEYEIPSMLHRALAEIIDFCILFFLKTVCLMFVVYYVGVNFSIDVPSEELLSLKLIKLLSDDNLHNVENFEKFMKEEFSDDYLDALENQLVYMMIVTLLYRLLTCIYEWLFIGLLGSTPGKELLGLKVVSCRISTSGNRHVAVVAPGTPVSMNSAWTRALIKNLMISLLIPAFLSAFFYPHNRTSYDILSNTIVVKKQRPHLIR